MKPIYAQTAAGLAFTFAIALGVSACIPQVQAPVTQTPAQAAPESVAAPEPAPTPVPAPTPTPTPVITLATYDNWINTPQTPGDWRYVSEPGESLAIFSATATTPLAAIRCDTATRRVGGAR